MIGVVTVATEADPHGPDGHLRDAHGTRLYAVPESVARLHHAAVRAGWKHTTALTPYHNLRALLELMDREGVDADRELLRRFAFRFVLGYGPNSTYRALDRLGVRK